MQRASCHHLLITQPTVTQCDPSETHYTILLSSLKLGYLKVRKAPFIPPRKLIGIRVSLLGFRIVLIEIPRISRSPQMRYNRSVSPSVIQIVPIDVLEPGMCFYGGGAAFHVSKALRCVYCAEGGDEGAGVG
jgi:hypothetical protein